MGKSDTFPLVVPAIVIIIIIRLVTLSRLERREKSTTRQSSDDYFKQTNRHRVARGTVQRLASESRVTMVAAMQNKSYGRGRNVIPCDCTVGLCYNTLPPLVDGCFGRLMRRFCFCLKYSSFGQRGSRLVVMATWRDASAAISYVGVHSPRICRGSRLDCSSCRSPTCLNPKTDFPQK